MTHSLLLSLAVLLFPLLAAAQGSAPAQVVLVRLTEGGPHQAVEDAFRGAFSGSVRTLTEARTLAYELRQARTAGTSAVVAIGAEAAQAVASAQAGLPVLVTLAPGAQAQAGTSVLPVYPAPARQARALRDALPKAKRVGLLYNPGQSRALAQQYAAAASALGLTVANAEVADVRGVAPLARALLTRVDALWLVPDSSLITADTFQFLVKHSFERKVPLVGYSEGMCRSGALLALEVDPAEVGRGAAGAAKRLVAGGAPTAGPGEGHLCLNTRAAQLLGVELPAALRTRANRLIAE